VFTHFLANNESIEMANPASRPLVTAALIRHKKTRRNSHRALPYTDLAVFLAALRTRTSISAIALEFTILTALRTNEVINAKWDWVNWDDKTFTVPKEQMKTGDKLPDGSIDDGSHVVPLSPRAYRVLEDLHTKRSEGCDFIFEGMRYNEPLCNMALLKVIALMGYAGRATTHGFRATMRTWASSETSHEHEVREKALAHIVGDETERSYNRGGLLKKRRALMDDWAAFLAPPAPAPVELPDNVVALRA